MTCPLQASDTRWPWSMRLSDLNGEGPYERTERHNVPTNLELLAGHHPQCGLTTHRVLPRSFRNKWARSVSTTCHTEGTISACPTEHAYQPVRRAITTCDGMANLTVSSKCVIADAGPESKSGRSIGWQPPKRPGHRLAMAFLPEERILLAGFVPFVRDTTPSNPSDVSRRAASPSNACASSGESRSNT